MLGVLLLSLILTGLLLGCAADGQQPAPPLPPVAPHPEPSREHHPPDGRGPFRNLDPPIPRPFWPSVRWIAGRIFSQRTHPPTPFRPIYPEEFRLPEEGMRLFWLGHSTVLIGLDTLWLLTDPVFSRRVSPVSFAGPVRQVALPAKPKDLPPIALVLISHNHYDHLDKASILELERRFEPLFLVPLRVGRHLRNWGVRRVRELDWWEYVDVGPLRLFCTPARHFSNRGLTDRNRDLWASWYVQHRRRPDYSLYFGGDTGYGSHFRLIRQRLGPPRVALLPIGAYEPRWFMQEVHVDPEEALRAFQDLEAEHMLAIHWGTFDQADEPLDQPPRRLMEAAGHYGLPTARLHVLPVGGSLYIGPADRQEGASRQQS